MAVDVEILERYDGTLESVKISNDGRFSSATDCIMITVHTGKSVSATLGVAAGMSDDPYDVPDTADIGLNLEELICLRDLLTRVIDEHKPAP